MPRLHSSLSRAVLLAIVAASLLAAPSAHAGTLYASVGPGHVISLRTASGTLVRSVRAGTTHTVVVRDRGTTHNFRLSGPGFSRQTGVSATGTQRWRVRFARGTWTYKCSPHSVTMRRTFRAG